MAVKEQLNLWVVPEHPGKEMMGVMDCFPVERADRPAVAVVPAPRDKILPAAHLAALVEMVWHIQFPGCPHIMPEVVADLLILEEILHQEVWVAAVMVVRVSCPPELMDHQELMV